MENKVLISVAMATFNGELYLEEQINSILKQTYPNIELIICDDASTDSTRVILEKKANEDSRIKLYYNNQNLGFKKNFEKIMSYCNGDFVAFCDQDDVWNLDKLEVSILNIGNFDFVCGNASLVDKDLNPLEIDMKTHSGFNYVDKNRDVIFEHMLYNPIVQGATILARKDFILSNLPIPEEFRFHDWWFAFCACKNNGFLYLDDSLLLYRQHGNNVTSNSVLKKKSFTMKLRNLIFTKVSQSDDTQQRIDMINYFLKDNSFRIYENKLLSAKTYWENCYSLHSIFYYLANFKLITFDSSVMHRIKYSLIMIYRKLFCIKK